MGKRDRNRRPDKSEYFEYYETYVSRVPDGDVLEFLEAQLTNMIDTLKGISEEKAGYRYAPGKWSLKEVLGHVVDMEWVFTYRILSFARNQAAPLASVDQDDFVAAANFDSRTFSGMVDEFRHVRTANLLLFADFDDSILDRRGIASGKEFTARSALYTLAGHVEHHIQVVRDKYLAGNGK